MNKQITGWGYIYNTCDKGFVPVICKEAYRSIVKWWTFQLFKWAKNLDTAAQEIY